MRQTDVVIAGGGLAGSLAAAMLGRAGIDAVMVDPHEVYPAEFRCEKLDGVRAWWDGRQFLSRQGNVYHAPQWFTAGLPNVCLDGELWLGRKAFQRPMKDGVALLNAIQDVYLSPKVTIA